MIVRILSFLWIYKGNAVCSQKMEIQETSSMEYSRRENIGRYLVWEDLTVVVLPNLGKAVPRRLLTQLSGYAEPGRIMAIMGPSGSGKSTLLDSLAGRLSTSVIMTGDVHVNGKKRSKDNRGISYVAQDDFFLGTLTVRETITYSAYLRLPTTITKAEANQVVEKTIMEMGLHDCADKKIGSWNTRGISNGEKRRLSISLEILTCPDILLLDEPTSGLDSASAFFIIQYLRSIARDGRIVVCSIHQPTSDVFHLLDDLLLLSDGEAVYFGEAKMCIEFFADAGFPCPIRRNPSDHFLNCINPGIQLSPNPVMRMTKSGIKATLVEKYRCRRFSMVARRIQEMRVIKEAAVSEPNKESNAMWWKQLCTLTHRSFTNMSRDMGYYWLRMIFYILVSFSVGTIYFDVGKTNSAIVACDGFIYGFMVILSLGGLPFFIEEMKVFYRERFNEQYGEGIFVLSNLLSSFPFLVAISLSSGTILYYMVKIHSGFSYYAYSCINFFCCIAIMEGCVIFIASLVPNLLMGIAAGAGVMGIMVMASVISRPLPQLPKFFWRYPMSYISFVSWALQGQYKNDMIGLEFDPLIPGEPKLKGETVLQTMFGTKLNHSKWWDLTAVMSLLFFYRLLFFIVIKYKDGASLSLLRQYANRTLQHLQDRATSPSIIFSRGPRSLIP